MVRGFYTAGSGMVTQSRLLDVHGNNIANARTPGFKRDKLITEPFESQLAVRLENGVPSNSAVIGNVNLGVTGSAISTDFSNGDLEQTGRELDLAILGDGFFTIEMANGQRLYTRNGQFYIGDDGYIYSLQGGGRLVGQNGAINTNGRPFAVDEAGNVTVNGNYVDRLLIHVPADRNTLVKHGEGMFADTGNGGLAFGGSIRQGWLETSNVDFAKEMTDIMASQRLFQSCSQIAKMIDLTLQKSVEIGRL